MHDKDDGRFPRVLSSRQWLLGSAALALFVTLVLPAPTQAATATQPQTTPPAETVVQEVIVTARLREERLQDVPVSATVITGEAISNQQGGQINPVDLFLDVPGMRVNNTGSPGTTEYSMRGSGTARATSADSGVALYRDGFFIGGGLVFGRTFLSIDLFDMDRTEVLRGTQGALYGRDAVGGAINIISARPQFDSSGYGDVDYNATLGRVATQVVQNAKVSDTVAVRLSAEYDNQTGGFYYNSNFHNYLDGGNGYMLRGQILYRSSNGKFNADLLVEHQDETLPGIMTQIVFPPGTAGFPGGFTAPKYSYAWNISGDPALGVTATDSLLSLTYDLGWATWSSTTGVRLRHGFSINDNSTLAPGFDPNVDQYVYDDTNNYFEETHLTGQLGKLTWLAGGDYLDVPTTETGNVTRTPTVANPSTGSTQHNFQTWTSAAIFGSVDYALTSKLDLDAEGRYTWDDKTFHSYVIDDRTGAQLASPAPFHGSTAPGNFSYNVTLSFKPREGELFYVKVGSGYRVGGFNATLGDPRQPTPIPPTYGDETTMEYELGTKDTFASWLYVIADVYYADVTGVLTQDNNGCFIGNPICPVQGTNFVVNAGKAYDFGVETEAHSQFELLGGKVGLQVNGAYGQGKFTSGAYDGLTVPQTPRWELSTDARYDHRVSHSVSAFASVNFSGQWGGTQDVTKYPLTLFGVTTNVYEPLANEEVLDLRAGLDIGHAEVAVYGNNITDDEFYLFRAPTSFRWGPRDSWGVQLRYKW